MSRKSSSVWGVRGKNAQQTEAITALMSVEIDLVVLVGKAGSGKTLLALASGLEQVVESKTYNKIIFTRAPIAVGSDLGFLPGTVDDKMLPWCGALLDNLEYLNVDSKDVARYISFAAMQHMRGRSLTSRYVIIDEVQNISKDELKVLLTRAGEGSKFVCLGDPYQIDNKKLSIETNGLQHLISRAKDCQFIQVIELPEGVRSRLCSWSADSL